MTVERADMITTCKHEERTVGPSAVLITNRKKRRERDTSLDRESNKLSLSSLGGLRPSKSMSNLFHKTLSFKGNDRPHHKSTIELSTDDSAPGVLKIFGDSITPGAHYKSVLATQTSTAHDLVKEALDRYNIATSRANDYRLCDVIGKMTTFSEEETGRNKENNIWTEECVRMIDNRERPLTLQAYWKPAKGYVRRFELRKHSEVDTLDDAHHSVKPANCLQKTDSISVVTKCGIIDVSPVHNPNSGASKGRRASCKDVHTMSPLDASVINTNHSTSINENNVATGLSNGTCKMSRKLELCPESICYLLCLKCYDLVKDLSVLICPIARDQLNEIGSYNNINNLRIKLSAPDVLPLHCSICKLNSCQGLSQSGYHSEGDNPPQTGHNSQLALVPSPNASIKLNGKCIKSQTLLKSGDILTIGDHYVFMYKCHGEMSEEENFNRTMQVLSHLRVSEDTDSLVSASTMALNDDVLTLDNVTIPQLPGKEEHQEVKEVKEWRQTMNKLYENDYSRLKLSFVKGKEDVLLEHIVKLLERSPSGFKLAPAYMLSMAVEYCAVKYNQVTTRDLIMKIASIVQNTVWVTI